MNLRTYLCASVLVGTICAGQLPASVVAADRPHHKIVLRADPTTGVIIVSNRITISGGRTITLSVAPWMRINSVHLDGEAWPVDGAGNAISLPLPEPRLYRIEVAMEGAIPPRKKGQRGPRSAGKPFASEEGLYLPGWTNWIPGISSTPADYELTVETPAPFRAVATGRLISEDSSAQINKSVFAAQKSSEAPSVFAGPYEVEEKRSGPIRIRTYFHHSAAGLAKDYLETSERFIKRYAGEIGPYPFADFHVVSAPLPVGVGFPNLTYIDARILRLPFMRGRSLAHEVLHNWWGNGVAADYARGNWSEGLTTYLADHALAEERDPKKGAEMRLGWLRDYAALPNDLDIPVTRFRSKRHDASQVIGYGKVAFIFHMLKHEAGPERFRDAIRRFWATHKHGTASWNDIRLAFEESTNSDLEWFFDQWTGRAGAPALTFEQARVTDNGGTHNLQISLSQSAPYYRLKVPVDVIMESRVQKANIRLDGARKTTTLELDARPIAVHIDPDYTLFRRLLPDEAPPILRDILLDTSARMIVLGSDKTMQNAARALAARLFESPPERVPPGSSELTRSAHLVVGSTDDISHFIRSAGLPERPAALPRQGSARAWTAARKSGNAILFVEADDSEALNALLRPLPHYRAKSFIVFEGRRAIAHGVWPVSAGPLTKNFR